ncbi:hypothetical protein RMP76_118 [Saccharomyces cerevisiae synthetic construct]|nr:hypothetical protein RMP76_118 [Saccharomyces cerevisiae synthetic construct]
MNITTNGTTILTRSSIIIGVIILVASGLGPLHRSIHRGVEREVECLYRRLHNRILRLNHYVFLIYTVSLTKMVGTLAIAVRGHPGRRGHSDHLTRSIWIKTVRLVILDAIPTYRFGPVAPDLSLPALGASRRLPHFSHLHVHHD